MKGLMTMNQIEKNTVKAENQLAKNQFISFINPEGTGKRAVIKWENDFTDSPTVFKKDGVFYMYFIAISKDCNVSGYETHLAKSDDLINWEY